MPSTLNSLIADPPSGRRKAVLFDHHDYAQAVLLEGRDVPWHDPMAYALFFGQAQALLRSDAALLDLGRFYDHLLATSPTLVKALGAKSRTGYALRTLLGDATATARTLEFATAVIRTVREPVVLQIPSPLQWLARTHGASGAQDLSALDADAAENASMYVADWLRGWASLPVAGLLLDDRTPIGGLEPPVAVELATYTPVTNVTDHYRWPLGLRRTDHVTVRGSDAVGTTIAGEFWLGPEQPLPTGDFFITQIPSSAVPEEVLARLPGAQA